MKTFKNIIKKAKTVFAFTAVMLVGSSCDNFLDVNTNPNLTLDNPPELILPSVEAMIGFSMGSDVTRYTLLFSQQMSAQNGRQTENFDLYIIQPTEVNGLFRTNLYAGALADIEKILVKPANTIHPHYIGISKILKAFTYSVLTDLFGDVPFTEAIQGESNGNYAPKLDGSQAIYTNCVRLIDEGIAEMRKTSPLRAVGNDDYIYRGNAARWIKFANTLKLRLLLHTLNLPNADRNAVVSFVTNTPATEFMEAVADNFQLSYEATARRQNPVHQFITDRTDDLCTSSTIIDMMNAKADPRRSVYFTPAPFSPALLTTPPTGNTGYVGLRNGTGAGGVRNNLSRLHTYVRGAQTSLAATAAGPTLGVTAIGYNGTAPTRMLTFAEYNFIRAELALRYGAPGNAQEFYANGIRASFADAGLPATAATAYLATPSGTLEGTPTDQLREIMEEKYIANFMVALEPWNDWKRTGFPLLTLLTGINNVGNNGRVPRVLPYPQQEVDANPNMQQRANMSTNPVFWDVRTTGQQ